MIQPNPTTQIDLEAAAVRLDAVLGDDFMRLLGDVVATDLGVDEIMSQLGFAANQGATDSSPRDQSDPKRQRKPSLAPPAERGTAAQAAAILGLHPRKLQAMAQRGAIPGAAKLGRQWTFDLTKLRRFVEQQEQATCQSEKPRPDATGAGTLSGARFRSKASASGGRLQQMIRQSQRRVAKQAKNAH